MESSPFRLTGRIAQFPGVEKGVSLLVPGVELWYNKQVMDTNFKKRYLDARRQVIEGDFKNLNDMQRKAEYSRIIKDADKHEMISLIKTLYLRRKELAESGKKLRSTDENYLNLAENMLFEEFAYALDIDRSEVVEYIEKHIA